MKTIVVFLVTIVLFSNCSEKRASHEDALKFYVTIVKTSVRESNVFDEFKVVLKSSFETASARNPQKLNSLELSNLEKSFRDLTNVYDSIQVVLNQLSEVDNEITLKSLSVEALKENNESIRKYFPVLIKQLTPGVETAPDANKKEKDSFHESAEKVKKINAQVEEFDTQFRKKYNIQDEELKKYGLEGF